MRLYRIEISGDRYKIVGTNDYHQALRMYAKFKDFAIKHGLTLNVSLWESKILLESEIINPTRVIKLN